MPLTTDRRRVLLAARPSEAVELHAAFGRGPLKSWDVLNADSFERARFLLQHNPCDVLLVDESLYHGVGPIGLSWLVRTCEVPAIFLTGMEPETMADAYEQGVSLCLPRRASLDHPPLLAAGMQRTALVMESIRCNRRTKDSLNVSRRQVDRLVNLLWRAAPVDPNRQWFGQRQILERLQEEVARSGRHGGVFTVAIGEVQTPDQAQDEQELPEWTTDALVRSKRRCDVAGYYGLNGFMLLMVQTPKDGGATCCRRLQQYVKEAAQPPRGPHGPIRTCFGLSSYSADNATAQSLLSRAEKHLEAAKAGVAEGVVAD